MSTSTLTPWWPLPALLTSLARAGWGVLRGREWAGVRTALSALCSLLPHGSARGHVTVAQLAEVGSMSERWIGRCLHVLLDLGVIRWQTGGVVAGQPRPSYITVVKSALVDIILTARPEHEEREAGQRRRVREKVAGLRYAYGWHRDGRRARERQSRSHPPAQHHRRSGQVEGTPTLHLLAEESPARSARMTTDTKQHQGAPSGALTVSESANAVRNVVDAQPGECEHGGPLGLTPGGRPRCPLCRALGR